MYRGILSSIYPQPVCAGTGLVTLDIVINGDATVPPRMWVGGSCGNVLTILSYLGWKSIPLIRLGKDEVAQKILEDWQQFGIDCNNVEQDTKVSTPMIVEKIHLSNDGNPTHRFFWTCPNCGTWLPRYRPIRLANAKRAFSQIAKVNCFYFDRVSPAALEIATQAKKAGALVVFEPPSIKDNEPFRKAIKICHILKYANNCVREYGGHVFNDGPILVIETLGKGGIRYRFNNRSGIVQWKELSAFSVKDFRDACGAGDWCTAGIIYKLGESGSKGLKRASEKKIIEALEVGQAMAALNCRFEGARGGMYVLGKKEFKKAINRILSNRIVEEPSVNTATEDICQLFSCLCPGCKERVKKEN
jgi:fructokinase